ncbi:MAG: glutamate synthase [Dethiobacter sp.]|nr:glutamate synthase [Dethiobacter sp.]
MGKGSGRCADLTIIDAGKMHFRQLNDKIRGMNEDVTICGCMGQRYLGCGLKGKVLTIHGTPGNAMGAYLDGGSIIVHGNAQDAVGDTMNDGAIIIHGNVGDAPGYGMRGGKIYVRGNSGYRTGIHMKQHKDKKPVIIVGGSAGSFLGEYLAGGILIVLGIGVDRDSVGNFCGTGMHGGKILIRNHLELPNLPEQVVKTVATDEEKGEIADYLREYCSIFSQDFESLIKDQYLLLRPDSQNPYKKLYTYY